MRMRSLLLLIPLLALSACTSLSALSPQTLDQKVYAVNQTSTAVAQGADVALKAHLITKAQAESVSVVLHQVNPLIDSARAAEAANDSTNANKTMNLISTLLAGLQAYVPPPVAK